MKLDLVNSVQKRLNYQKRKFEKNAVGILIGIRKLSDMYAMD